MSSCLALITLHILYNIMIVLQLLVPRIQTTLRLLCLTLDLLYLVLLGQQHSGDALMDLVQERVQR